ncbi:FAD:protein FMN transferase [soil metagenome]
MQPAENPTRRSTRRAFLLLGGAAALGAYALAAESNTSTRKLECAGRMKILQRTSRALGTDISMLALHENAAAGERAIDAAFAELGHVEQVMSIYLPGSQLSRLNREGVLGNPDPYLVRVFRESQRMAEQSGGAFDITVQPLWNLYAAASKSGVLPADAEIDAARRSVDWRSVSITDGEIRLRDKGMSVTLNGIAQGFAADRAMEALRRGGVEHALVNTGEIASLGTKAGGEPWTVGIQHPRKADAYLGLAKLAGRCMSTSGDYETTFSADRAYNHIFEPWSGRSPIDFASVTVIAPSATQADMLSTAIFVLGAEKGRDLAQSLPGVDVAMVLKGGRQLASDGFPWNA